MNTCWSTRRTRITAHHPADPQWLPITWTWIVSFQVVNCLWILNTVKGTDFNWEMWHPGNWGTGKRGWRCLGEWVLPILPLNINVKLFTICGIFHASTTTSRHFWVQWLLFPFISHDFLLIFLKKRRKRKENPKLGLHWWNHKASYLPMLYRFNIFLQYNPCLPCL